MHVAAKLHTTNIPKLMRETPHWLVWRREVVNGKPTKVPYQAKRGGKRAKAATDNPSTWATFDETLAVYEGSGYDGLGFVFAESVPLCGLDLDHCLDKDTGELAPWAAEIVDAMNSYTEVSPSGDGLHIVIEAAQAPFDGMKTSKRMGEGGKLELFAHGVYFTGVS